VNLSALKSQVAFPAGCSFRIPVMMRGKLLVPPSYLSRASSSIPLRRRVEDFGSKHLSWPTGGVHEPQWWGHSKFDGRVHREAQPSGDARADRLPLLGDDRNGFSGILQRSLDKLPQSPKGWKLLRAMKDKLYSTGFVFVDQSSSIEMLGSLGASEQDLKEMRSIYETELRPDRYYPSADTGRVMREVAMARTALVKHEVTGECELKQLPRRGFSVAAADQPIGEWADKERKWRTIDEIVNKHNGFRAVQTLISEMVDLTEEPATSSKKNSDLRVLEQFAIRTLPPGEPSPEGVHQDGNELTLVMLLGRSNCRNDSGYTNVFSLEAPTGAYDRDDPQEKRRLDKYLLDSFVMSKPFEFNIMLDRRAKHEATPGKPLAPGVPCSRDVLINFLRAPLVSGEDRETELTPMGEPLDYASNMPEADSYATRQARQIQEHRAQCKNCRERYPEDHRGEAPCWVGVTEFL